MRALISSLCEQDEQVYLEFKSEWYWAGRSVDERKWGEFLKDFAALVNCTPDHVDDHKYLIIGVDETKENLDRFNNVSIRNLGFETVDNLKDKIDEKLKTYFKFEDNKQIKDCYELKEEKFNGKNILYFNIKPVRSLLVLSKDLRDKKRTEKLGNVFIRASKSNGEPEVKNACPNTIRLICDKFKSRSPRVKKESNIGKSVQKTVHLFLNKNSIFKEVGYKSEKKWKDKILFEVYNLESDFLGKFDIVYLFKSANQIKTREYLISNGIISEISKKYILVDDGINIDFDGVKNKFSAEQVYTLGGFAREHLYSDLLSEDSYHDGQFKKQRQIKNFIEPSTVGCNDKNAILLLNEWFSISSNPLMVVKGYGGVGKTTLVKYFLDKVHLFNRGVSDGYRVVFIDSKRIIDEISTEGMIDNLFYFYNAHAKVNDFENKFNQELLELSIDNGNILIVVDGIDEVIAKLNNKFDVNSFIESIFESYLIGNEKTKIILTCRDYFWDLNTDDNYNISKLELSPFTRELTERFFAKEYNKDSSEFRKCMEYADEFKFDTKKDGDNRYVYIPYTLDLISDMIKQKREFGVVNRDDIETTLLKKDLTDDYFIGRICNREIQKLENVDVDSQIKFFMKLSIFHNGLIHESNLTNLLSHIDLRNKKDIEELFKGHTLVNFDNSSKLLSFKYDFFKEFFVNLYICSFLNRKDLSKYSDELINVISEFVKYNTAFTNRISKRVNFDEDLEIFIIELIELSIKTLKEGEQILHRRVISSLICILLSCHQNTIGKLTIEDCTNIIKDIFGDNLEYFSIINLFGKDSDKLIFDFRNKVISNVWMENYPFFWECRFDNGTTFNSSTFKHLEPRNNVTIPKIHDNMFVNCDTSGIHDLIVSSNNQQDQKNKSLVDDVKKIFKLFDTGGTLKEQKTERIEKHANSIVLKELKKNKVITPYVNPKKPRIRQYKVHDDYLDIINVLDQNGTSYELEKVMKLITT
ncbi:hypothetical protein AAFX30_20905 [Vibrio chagasii]|uniref:NACHT domain-containing protein n=2 Tax=Vibrio TaxID=662 RepID=UPI0038CDA7B9